MKKSLILAIALGMTAPSLGLAQTQVDCESDPYQEGCEAAARLLQESGGLRTSDKVAIGVIGLAGIAMVVGTGGGGSSSGTN